MGKGVACSKEIGAFIAEFAEFSSSLFKDAIAPTLYDYSSVL